jgi:MFS family permease
MLQSLSINAMSSKRVARIAVSSLFFLTGLCFASWASRIPAIQQSLHLSEGGLGGVLLALPIGSMISMPVAGYLVSRFGSKQVVLVAGLLYAIVLPVLGMVQTSWQLFAVLMLFGFTGNLANIAVNTQAVAVEGMYGRTVMASFHGLWSLAGFTGAAIGAFMAGQEILPYHHFLLITVMGVIIVALSGRHIVPHKEAELKKETMSIWERAIRRTVKFVKRWRNPAVLARMRYIWARRKLRILWPLVILGIIAFCSMICEGTMFDWSGVYFKKVIKAPDGTAGIGYAAFMSTMASFRFIADWLTTRLGARRVLQLSGALTASGLLIAVLLPYFATAIFGFLLVGAGVSSVVPLVYSAAGKSKTMSPGMALAAVSTIGYLGFLVGPPLIGFVAQASSLSISFSIIAIMGTCIAVMGSRVKA